MAGCELMDGTALNSIPPGEVSFTGAKNVGTNSLAVARISPSGLEAALSDGSLLGPEGGISFLKPGGGIELPDCC